MSFCRWAFVEIESKTTWPDEMQAFAAGMAEGYLTKDLIYDFWRNTVEVRRASQVNIAIDGS